MGKVIFICRGFFRHKYKLILNRNNWLIAASITMNLRIKMQQKNKQGQTKDRLDKKLWTVNINIQNKMPKLSVRKASSQDKNN